MAALLAAAPVVSLRAAPRRHSGAAAPLAARTTLRGSALVRAVRLPSARAPAPQAASCSAAHVGAVTFGGKGSVGAARFTPAASKAGGVPKWMIFAGIGIGGPTLAAIATALASPVARASAGVPLKAPIAATFAALAVYYWVVNQVSVARYKYKVPAPATVGVSADFDRYLRVQLNMVEQLALFMPTLWLAATLVSPVAAGVAGGVWCIGRVMYAQGYYEAAAKRGPGFGVATLAQVFLLVLSGIGAARVLMA